jgi:hypothetical protein
MLSVFPGYVFHDLLVISHIDLLDSKSRSKSKGSIQTRRRLVKLTQGRAGYRLRTWTTGKRAGPFPGQSEADYLLEVAWGIIANAGWDEWSGDVNQEKTEGWLEATLRWREDYFYYLKSAQNPGLDTSPDER